MPPPVWRSMVRTAPICAPTLTQPDHWPASGERTPRACSSRCNARLRPPLTLILRRVNATRRACRPRSGEDRHVPAVNGRVDAEPTRTHKVAGRQRARSDRAGTTFCASSARQDRSASRAAWLGSGGGTARRHQLRLQAWFGGGVKGGCRAVQWAWPASRAKRNSMARFLGLTSFCEQAVAASAIAIAVPDRAVIHLRRQADELCCSTSVASQSYPLGRVRRSS